MADHDGHTVNVGPVTVGEIVTGGEGSDATELGEAILEEAEFSTAAHVHRVDGPVGCHHCRELTK